ncbi:pantoate--beta-alanine ligase [Pseudomonas aeruginosa]|uniref:pantoate--beta-alanine ligase n=1 Tax=Pseudomonas aeruginosa TaxID=287 RepID=UPI00071BF216|nr:pantoate--beta-alanine ligase [Pseudomonas aeruginosa]KSQ25070.1 pantoate--beta-alanine ligase [Pseudomonas aeruginosa]MCO1690438.1 pantoate--beta-alanine ligase [Pseudomonas aeruginosa]MCO1778634.1 pantoate--beta-alanine ligase [Pseudomonas aeruginosa]MCO1790057.1 pantoate--beta-alanine ligase [Pseudomonas aeruginosa]MCO1799379.1 pantoate--beta-alanine ligase [Pseudomonas aeruginosa]
MITTGSIEELRAILHDIRRQNSTIGLVPTMGNLHHGHLSLLETARRESHFVVTSIFVNPLQFGPKEDLQAYPRTPQEDRETLARAGCDLLFAPDTEEMYPNGLYSHCSVSVPGISESLCGESRPRHFEGVATVISKLFNIVQPNIAVFGQKDYQQLAVIRTLARGLNFPVRVLGAPTVRAPDGLALSSRNGYLSPAERNIAPLLYTNLKRMVETIEQGEQDFSALIQSTGTALEQAGFNLDYLDIRSARTLQAATATDQELVIMVAAFLGKTRLIDNLECRRPVPSE